MKKILFLILISMSMTCFGQDSQNIDSIQVNDSIHTGSTINASGDVTKAEGDSAYIKRIMLQPFKYMRPY